MTPHHLRIAAELLDFHRCPNTGRVLHSTKGDDKAFCRCGQPNPHLPNETLHAHFKEFMARATVEDFVEQELWSGVEFSEPTSNPPGSGGITYVKDGRMWFKTSDGRNYPYPLPLINGEEDD
jgi:hypothetical protein